MEAQNEASGADASPAEPPQAVLPSLTPNGSLTRTASVSPKSLVLVPVVEPATPEVPALEPAALPPAEPAPVPAAATVGELEADAPRVGQIHVRPSKIQYLDLE